MLPALQYNANLKICQCVCGLSIMNAGAFSRILFQVVLLLPGGDKNVSKRHWTVE